MMPDLFDAIDPPRRINHPHQCPCGSNLYRLEPGKGPHAAHLRCDACNRGGLWMAKLEYDILTDTGPAGNARRAAYWNGWRQGANE